MLILDHIRIAVQFWNKGIEKYALDEWRQYVLVSEIFSSEVSDTWHLSLRVNFPHLNSRQQHKIIFFRIDFICLPDPNYKTTKIERHGVVQSSVVLASVVSTSVPPCPKDQCMFDNNKICFDDEQEYANSQRLGNYQKYFQI